MQCEYVYGNKQCNLEASWNSTFCSIHDGVHQVSPSTRPDFRFRSDRAFTPHSDKLTKDQKTFIKGLGNKPKIVIKKERPIMIKEPKPIPQKEHELMTIREVADILRVSMLTLKRWGKLGKIKCIRINSRGDRRYLRSEINKLLGGNV